MDTGQRELTLNDPAFGDAMLEQPPILSGFFLAEDFKGTISPEIQRDRDIVAAAKEKRLAGMFGPQLTEITELEKTVADANMIADIARVDLQSHSGMEPLVFAEFVKRGGGLVLLAGTLAAWNTRPAVAGLARTIARKAPLYLILDGDLAQTLGGVLREDLGVESEILVIDGVVLVDFDYIDLGRIRLPSRTIPVTIKSLVFNDAPRIQPVPHQHHGHDHHHHHGHEHGDRHDPHEEHAPDLGQRKEKMRQIR